jgi:hypothetical protein
MTSMNFLKKWTIDINALPEYKEFRGEFSEPLDATLMRLLLESDEYTEPVKTCLRTHIYDNLVHSKDGLNKVKYNQPFGIGRFYGNSYTITEHKKKIKHTLMSYSGWCDIDQVKGHPTIICELGRLNGVSFSAIEKYVADPETQFHEMREYYGVDDEDVLKWLFNMMIYGGSHATWVERVQNPTEKDIALGYKGYKLKNTRPRQFETKFKTDCNKVCDTIYDSNYKIVERLKQIEKYQLKDEAALKRSVVSFALGIIENHALFICYKCIKRMGLFYNKQVSLEKDGLCFKPVKTLIKDDICRDINGEVFKKMGMKITYKFKDYKPENIDDEIINIRNTIPNDVVDDGNDDYTYNNMKIDFEKNKFKCGSQFYYVKPNGSLEQFSRDNFKTKYEHLNWGYNFIHKTTELDYTRPKSFMNRWLCDADIRIIDEIVCCPRGITPPPNSYNSWREYKWETMKDEYVSQTDACLELLDFIKIQCNNHEETYKWFLEWIGMIIQEPSWKIGRMPIFTGQKGTGKSMMVNIIKRIIGEEQYFSTSKPEEYVWGKFTSFMEGVKVVDIEEFGTSSVRGYENHVKDIITSDTIQINGKGLKPYTIDNYIVLIGTTNEPDPVKIQKGERRFALIRSSSEKKGDLDYFKRIDELIRDDKVIRTLYDYIKTIDVGYCKTIREPPENEYDTEIKEINKDCVQRFLEQLAFRMLYIGIDRGDNVFVKHSKKEYSVVELLREYTLFGESENQDFKMSSVSFGKKLLALSQNGFKGVDKRKSCGCMVYELDFKLIENNE